ncbi:MAG: hypothetical protein RLZZ116_1942 [Planctomycetota bacterium]|jgi:hypothetical protein
MEIPSGRESSEGEGDGGDLWGSLDVSARRWRQRRNRRHRMRHESTGPTGMDSHATRSADFVCGHSLISDSVCPEHASSESMCNECPQMKATPESAEPLAREVDSHATLSGRRCGEDLRCSYRQSERRRARGCCASQRVEAIHSPDSPPKRAKATHLKRATLASARRQLRALYSSAAAPATISVSSVVMRA